MAQGPAIEIAIAEKRFGADGPPLLRDFVLDIAPASVVALVGPSGVGKSTLLRLVAGIDTAFAGRIALDGMRAADAPPAGFVFQDSRLLPWLTALDNIRAVAPGANRETALAQLAEVGLAASADAWPHQLSGGMQRRVALARAFAVNPRLLLLDEPFVSLDRHLVAEVQRLFLALLQRSGGTAILVTHLAEDAARLADRAVLLSGRPARIVGDIAFGTSRMGRSADTVLALTRRIEALGMETAQ